jgi:hypothetical protein
MFFLCLCEYLSMGGPLRVMGGGGGGGGVGGCAPWPGTQETIRSAF